jgi:fatty acid desaturase
VNTETRGTATALDGRIEEAYQKAQEYLGKGSYARALKLLRQIERLRPGYQEVATLIPQAEEGKRVQTFVQWTAVITGMAFLVAAWFLGLRNDLALLAVGAAGIVLGIFVGNVVYAARAARREGQRGNRD